MKGSLLLTAVLAGCASQGTKMPFEPPLRAASHEDLMKALPQELFRGDIAGDNRPRAGAESEYLDFVFLKNEDSDAVPMRVALYRKVGDHLQRDFVAATPFVPGECRRGECRARISVMLYGFQLSRESLAADHLRTDYRFVLDGKDLKLTGKGFSVKNPAGGFGKEGTCTRYVDYEHGKIRSRAGDQTSVDALPNTKAPHLIADGLKFDSASAVELCRVSTR
jgi:hypothetical protein